jgi:hypothetical protein
MQAPRNSYGQIPLAGAGSADQHGVALFGEKGTVAKSRISVSLIGVPVKSKASMSLASGSLATVSWYLIERAYISALSKSPTMRGGVVPFSQSLASAERCRRSTDLAAPLLRPVWVRGGGAVIGCAQPVYLQLRKTVTQPNPSRSATSGHQLIAKTR